MTPRGRIPFRLVDQQETAAAPASVPEGKSLEPALVCQELDGWNGAPIGARVSRLDELRYALGRAVLGIRSR
jgi:hypothetical protein